MAQNPSEKFLHFTVGLLKGSAALEALRQDATKYHMIDHPGQLIALRLTEYYELINQGLIQSGVQVPAAKVSPGPEAPADHEQIVSTDAPQRAAPIAIPSPADPLTNGQAEPASTGQTNGRLPAYSDAVSLNASESSTNALNQLTGKMRAMRRDNENIVAVSSVADENADDAADYWSTL